MTFTASISRSITLNCEGSTLYAVYIQSGQPEVTIVIHDVTIGNSTVSSFPVEFDNFGSLILDRVHIVGGALGSSIKFFPTGPARLMISNSIINKGCNFSNGTGTGLLVQPQPGGTTQVALDNVRIEGNVFGVAIDGSSSTGGVNATIRNSTIAGNRLDGLVAITSSGYVPIGVSSPTPGRSTTLLASARSAPMRRYASPTRKSSATAPTWQHCREAHCCLPATITCRLMAATDRLAAR